jgi:hypothetical protein
MLKKTHISFQVIFLTVFSTCAFLEATTTEQYVEQAEKLQKQSYQAAEQEHFRIIREYGSGADWANLAEFYFETDQHEKLAKVYTKIRNDFPDKISQVEKYWLSSYNKKAWEEYEQRKSLYAYYDQKLVQNDLKKCFSAWDGSHIATTALIKKAMNDPDSYKHDETRIMNNGTNVIVITSFRGKNAFGGMVKNSIMVSTDPDTCAVIEVLSEGK